MIRRRWRILLHVLGVIVCLLAAIPVLLYIPSVQQWAVESVVSYLNDDPDSPYDYAVGKVRLDFPANVRLEGINVTWRTDGSTFLSLDRLETGISHFPLFGNKFISLSQFRLHGLAFGADSLTSSLGLEASCQDLVVDGISVDLDNHKLRLESLRLVDPSLSVFLGPSEDDTTASSFDWTVIIDDVQLTSATVEYHRSDSLLLDALNGGKRIPYFDYNHLSFTCVSAHGDNFCYSDSLLSIHVSTMQGNETYSGLLVREASGYFTLAHGVSLQDLHLLTDLSNVDGHLHYDWNNDQASAGLSGLLSSADLTRFVSPYVERWNEKWPDQDLRFVVNGAMEHDHYHLDTLSLTASDYFHLNGQAQAFALTDSLSRELHLSLSGNLLRCDTLLSAFVLPRSERFYHIPDSASFDLRLDYDSLQLSSAGTVGIRESSHILFGAQYNDRTSRYQAEVRVVDVNATDFIDDVPLADATFSLSAQGRGLVFPSNSTMAEVHLDVDSVTLVSEGGRRDLFSDIRGELHLDRGEYQASFNSDYPVLQFASNLSGEFQPRRVSVRGISRILHADMKHLPAGLDIDYGVFTGIAHLSADYDWKSDVNLSLLVDSMTYTELQSIPRDSLGNPILGYLETVRGNHIFHEFDSISVNFHADAHKMTAYVHSGDCDITADVDASLREIGNLSNVIGKEVKRQLDNTSLDLNGLANVLPQSRIRCDLGERNPMLPLLHAYGYSLTQAHLSFDNDAFMQLNAHLCDLSLPSGEIYDTLRVHLDPSYQHTYQYGCRVVQFSLHPNDSYCLTGEGHIMRDSLTSRIVYADGAYSPIFDQTLSVAFEDDVITLRLLTDPILFARRFTVNPETEIDICHLSDPLQPWEVQGLVAFDLDGHPALRGELSYNDSVQADISLDGLPLDIANYFTDPTLSVAGSLFGRMTLKASTADIQKSLVMDGGISVANGSLYLPAYGMQLSLCDDTLRIGHNRLLVDDYSIATVSGSGMKLRGLIDFSRNLTDPTFSLTLLTDRTHLLRKTRRQNNRQLLAGTLPVSTDIRVEGPLSRLSVNGRINVLEGADLTYWLTEDPLQSGSKADELIDFVSFDELDRKVDTKTNTSITVQQPANSHSDGLTIQLKLDIDPATRMCVYLSPVDDSKVNFQGGGPLQMEMLPSSDLILSGTYDISQGSVDYKLPMLPVSKHFDLRDGSFVQWSGVSASNPRIHLIAGQDVRTSVSDQSSGTRLVTFAVDANIEGTLSALGVTFDCKAPDDGAIATELQALTDEDRQKQALMLLIAQTYIGPSSGSGNAALSTASAALNSLIDRELEGITSGLKHTKVDVGVDTYDDGGQSHTDVSLKVSQSFFHDRVRVTVGGKVSTGNDDLQQDQSAATLGDVSVDWMIRKDGSQYLDLFRRTNYQNILEGQVIEMGAGYVQERSAYRFLDLFSPSVTRRMQGMQELLRLGASSDSINVSPHE